MCRGGDKVPEVRAGGLTQHLGDPRGGAHTAPSSQQKEQSHRSGRDQAAGLPTLATGSTAGWDTISSLVIPMAALTRDSRPARTKAKDKGSACLQDDHDPQDESRNNQLFLRFRTWHRSTHFAKRNAFNLQTFNSHSAPQEAF